MEYQISYDSNITINDWWLVFLMNVEGLVLKSPILLTVFLTFADTYKIRSITTVIDRSTCVKNVYHFYHFNYLSNIRWGFIQEPDHIL